MFNFLKSKKKAVTESTINPVKTPIPLTKKEEDFSQKLLEYVRNYNDCVTSDPTVNGCKYRIRNEQGIAMDVESSSWLNDKTSYKIYIGGARVDDVIDNEITISIYNTVQEKYKEYEKRRKELFLEESKNRVLGFVK